MSRKHVSLPMVCRCGKHREDNSLREDVVRRLGEDPDKSRDVVFKDVTDANLLSALVYSLSIEHDAFVDSIDADQWCCVNVRVYDRPGLDDALKVSVECDEPLDGIMRIWKWLADGRPEEEVKR